MTSTGNRTITLKKDLVAGCILFVFALGFGAVAWFYPFGNASQMGPGFFPLILAGMLACLGAAVAIQGAIRPGEPILVVRWTALVCALASPLMFGLLVRPAGFLPAVFVATFVGTLAASGMRVPARFATSAVLALLTTAVFIWGLGLPLPAFGRWLPF